MPRRFDPDSSIVVVVIVVVVEDVGSGRLKSDGFTADDERIA